MEPIRTLVEDAVVEGESDESGAFLILREVLYLECAEEGTEMGLDGFGAQVQGVGNLAVRGRDGVVGAVVEWPAQFGEDGALRGCENDVGVDGAPMWVTPQSVPGSPW